MQRLGAILYYIIKSYLWSFVSGIFLFRDPNKPVSASDKEQNDGINNPTIGRIKRSRKTSFYKL